jgi:putative membrane protein
LGTLISENKVDDEDKAEDAQMGETAKVRETIGLYSKIWRLPTYQGILLRIFLSIGVSSIILSFLKSILISSIILLDAIIYYILTLAIPSFLGLPLMYLIVKKEGSPLDARRMSGAVQFGIIFWMVLGTLGGIVDLIANSMFFEIRFWLLGMSIGYLFFAFLITGLSDHHPIQNFMAAMVIPLLWLIMITVLSILTPTLPVISYTSFNILVALIILIVNSVVVDFIFRSVSQPFERDLKINGPELLRAFSYSYLVDNPEPFENLLSTIATIQDTPVEVIVFRKEEELLTVGVIPYVHPGPFRNIGSSGLPSMIMNHIKEKYSVPAFVMHGTCTHHQNLTTKRDYGLITQEIDRLIDETEVHDTISGPHWTDNGRFKVWTLFVGNDVLAITTSAPLDTDDIALEVGRDAANMCRNRVPELDCVAIVDAHNCIDGDTASVMPGDEAAEEYVGALCSSIFTTANRDRTTVSTGIHQFTPTNILESDGLGPGGITALVLDTNQREMALISIDANNMLQGFREKIIELLVAQGFDDVEVVTTDTHIVNAISVSSRGYDPIGTNKQDEILEAIGIAATKARENMKPTKIGIGFGEVKGLKTFGEKGFDTLTHDIAEAAGIAKRIGTITAGFAFLISLLLIFLF